MSSWTPAALSIGLVREVDGRREEQVRHAQAEGRPRTFGYLRLLLPLRSCHCFACSISVTESERGCEVAAWLPQTIGVAILHSGITAINHESFVVVKMQGYIRLKCGAGGWRQQKAVAAGHDSMQ